MQRSERYRVALGAGLAISAALHGFVLARIALEPPESAALAPSPSASPVELPEETIVLLRIEEPPDPEVPRPVLLAARPSDLPTASGELQEPREGEAPVALAGESPSSSTEASDRAGAGEPEAAFAIPTSRAQLPALASMRPVMSVHPAAGAAVLQPLSALAPRPELERDEGEGEEKRSWWRRLGAKLGFGKGATVCVPRPEIADLDDSSAGL
ncbi:MAG: hypothetical protein OXG58_02665 [Gemmatimonadetes bacterium]|nr:hypothetical protein [Gemmatimonadota bacterium]